MEKSELVVDENTEGTNEDFQTDQETNQRWGQIDVIQHDHVPAQQKEQGTRVRCQFAIVGPTGHTSKICCTYHGSSELSRKYSSKTSLLYSAAAKLTGRRLFPPNTNFATSIMPPTPGVRTIWLFSSFLS